MRLDLFLKHTRIIKRRSVAKTIIDNGHVLINDKIAKPSSDVKDNDILVLNLGPRELKIKVSIKTEENKIYLGFEQIYTSKGSTDASA